MNHTNLMLRCAVAASIGLASAANAAAPPDAGDYTALPAGTSLSLLYLQNTKADDVYSGGKRVALPRDLDFNLDLAVLRQVYFTKLGGYTIDPQIVVPFARQGSALAGPRPSGIGDVTFGGTVWTIADLAGGEHLGYTLLVTAPTGKHRDEGFAISDNRWAADMQVGYIKRIAPKWTVDLIGGAEVYQDRRDTGSEKKPMIRFIGHLRHHLNDATYVAASAHFTGGARETLGATVLNGRKKDANLALTVASFVTRQLQLQAKYSRDVRVENGPRLGTVVLRTVYAY